MRISAKICGIKDERALDTAIAGQARWIGLVFHAPSPRHVMAEQAALLARRASGRVDCVGLFVDPEDGAIETVLGCVKLDLLQLHGDETPERVVHLKQRFGLPVIKAVGVAVAEDLARVADYEAMADWIIFDAKAIKGALPGGMGAGFDWRLLSGQKFRRPWLLSGGLDPDNVAAALALTGAQAVDVSSGVESARGIKDPARIKDFLSRLND